MLCTKQALVKIRKHSSTDLQAQLIQYCKDGCPAADVGPQKHFYNFIEAAHHNKAGGSKAARSFEDLWCAVC